ncbi:uncharacterized protein LOC115876204 [Sitophilus oryzae]|uniref:Uncharacterized protein LOC115876204 n=1 Tax=Sitophilus oryzae TaxID=7048 RepID=A0A6J2X981_SITOR|nr:uncharacterized protein LOC115876204 [Sitophilus oryzae]
MTEGFLKASSDNLPLVDSLMVAEFFSQNELFTSAEQRGVKAKRAQRESYGNSAVGYVELKQDNNICTIKCKISPEHRVRSKDYTVIMEVNEDSEKILKAECQDCAASEGRCKHAIAFIMWVHRRSEEPSPTDVVSYWKKPKLSGVVFRTLVGTSLQYVTIQDFAKDAKQETVDSNNSGFLEKFIEKANECGAPCQLRHYFQEDKHLNLGIHQLLFSFNESEQTSDAFIKYASSKMSPLSCNEAFNKTTEQSECSLWRDFRYSIYTASKIFEASRCRTVEGSLVETIIGAAKTYDTPAMRRGRELENSVLRIVEKRLNTKLVRRGLMLSPIVPIVGASPDAYNSDIVIEIKCPSSEKTLSNYMVNGVITNKYLAQIQLQMFLMNKKSGVFCISAPAFEQNSEVKLINIEYDENFLLPII